MSRNPIAPLSESVSVPALLGAWTTAPAAEQPGYCHDFAIHLHIYPLLTPDGRQIELLVVMSEPGPSQRAYWATLEGYAVRLKNGLFLNLRNVAEGPAENLSAEERSHFAERQGYFLFATFDLETIASHRHLRLSTIDVPLAAAVYSGRLARGAKLDDIEDSSDRIADYLGSLDESDRFQNSCLFNWGE